MFSEMKTIERAEARRTREEEGCSVKEIAGRLRVSRSTVSLWVRDIPLTKEQRVALERRNPILNQQLNGAAANAELGRARRFGYQQTGRELAKERDSLHVAGCMLYWAEGAKARHQLRSQTLILR
jgi:transcriptional regulator with XRE-family HTH domain